MSTDNLVQTKSRTMELSSANFFKIRGDDTQYKEAIQQSIKFNRQFTRDRKIRIPALDAQTRITQDNCTLWNIRHLRQNCTHQGKVFKYNNVKRWVKNRRVIFHKDYNRNLPENQVHDSEIETSQDCNVKPSPQYIVATNSNDVSSWFDDSHDNLEFDLDSEEKTSKRKASKRKNKQNSDDKLFFCEKCGAKYKTKQGIGYHMEKSHGIKSEIDENTNSVSGSMFEEGNSSH